MKNINKILLFVFALFWISVNCYSQVEIIEKEKKEEVNRIKNVVQQFLDINIPQVQKMLVNAGADITYKELDSLILDIWPSLIIPNNCCVKADSMYYIDSNMMPINGLTFNYTYDYYIIPQNDKHTIYSAISSRVFTNNFEKGSIICIFTKERLLKYIYEVFYDKQNNPYLIERKRYPKALKSFPLYSDYYIFFAIGKEQEADTHTTKQFAPHTMLKDHGCIIFRDKIYSARCLQGKYKTEDYDSILKNNADSLCDCDIDNYFRINEKLSKKSK